MKKRFYLTSVAVVMFFVVVLVVCSIIESRYTREGRVICVDGEVITIEDTTGNIWEWEREEQEKEYKVNENIKMKMFNNYTDNVIEDDEIMRIKRGF